MTGMRAFVAKKYQGTPGELKLDMCHEVRHPRRNEETNKRGEGGRE
jgi:hypothetical protein